MYFIKIAINFTNATLHLDELYPEDPKTAKKFD